MGIFDFFKKEIYVNKLVVSYKDVHLCDDMVAINNLRQRYSAKDLKEILQILKKEEKKENLSLYLSTNGFTIFPL
jgi:hypothetical protein